MSIPNLKRVKLNSEQELINWLAKTNGPMPDVMLVTCNSKSHDKYLTTEQVRQAIVDRGYRAGRRYTLNGNLVGHVVSRGE